jgi:hypothetical protein
MLRIPLIAIIHSGRSRSLIPLIAIMMFTMPEAGVGNGMTRCCGLPLTVEQVSFLFGVRQVR